MLLVEGLFRISGSYLFIFVEIKTQSMIKALFQYHTVPSEFMMQAPEFFKCVYELNTKLVRSINFLAGIVLLLNRIEYINLLFFVDSDSFILPNVRFLGDFKARADFFVFPLA